MSKVKCDNCEEMINKEDVVPCVWEEYNLIWYYCKKCNDNCCDGRLSVTNKEIIEKLKSDDSSKSFSISNEI